MQAIGRIDLDHDVRGDPEAPVVLLVSGLGRQRVAWPDGWVAGLVERGLRVVTFDNRDCGQSTILRDAVVTEQMLPDMLAGRRVEVEYGLEDMAADVVTLLNGLGVARAHVVGVSMGGMIAQHLAFGHAERVASLVSIMSTTGSRNVGQPTRDAARSLHTPLPSERGAYIEAFAARSRVFAASAKVDMPWVRRLAAMEFDRGAHPAGVTRQLLAILADGDRTDRLTRVTAPTLVIHGRADPLIDLSGGQATAKAISGARLLVFDDMGHDIPSSLVGPLIDAISAHVEAVEGHAHTGFELAPRQLTD